MDDAPGPAGDEPTKDAPGDICHQCQRGKHRACTAVWCSCCQGQP